MVGLLYKDFASIRWKMITAIVSVATIVFLIFRVVSELLYINGIESEIVLVLQLVASMIFPLIFMSFIFYINTFPAKIIENENKNKISDYLGSMPVSDEQYVLSKYLFVGILVYISFSVNTVWGVIAQSFAGSGDELLAATADAVELLTSFIYPIAIIEIFMASIELPMIFMLGTAKMIMLKNLGMEALGIIVFGFMLFADMDWVGEHLSVEAIINWIDTHTFELTLLSIVSIILALGLFYLSYRFTCKMLNRRKYRIINPNQSERLEVA